MSTNELDDMAEIANERAARICKLSADNIILKDQLEASRADTARLDWLEEHLSPEVLIAFRLAHPTIREAIDAAMAWKKE